MILRVEHAPGDRPGVTIVRIYGEIDLATAPRLRADLQDLDRRGHHRLVLDLGFVDHLDSVGLGVLLGALRRARQAGGSATVTGLSAPVSRLFALLGLDTIFDATAEPGSAAPPASAPGALCGGRP
ncbi:MAG: STAS domain-containing protein [Acidimicrobiales bacterium]